MTHNDFLPPTEIIADVTTLVDDEGFDEFTPGWYESQVQQALRELAYDTHFDDRDWEAEVPECLEIPLPKGFMNVTRAYLFSGDRCGVHTSANLWWAREFNRHNGAMFKQQMGHQRDPILSNTTHRHTPYEVYFYNTRNGLLLLSDACRAFPKVFLQYKGLGCDFGSAPIIPTHLAEAVKDWVLLVAVTARMSRDRDGSWTQTYNVVKDRLYGSGSAANPGSWLKARRRVKHMDAKARQDLREYLSSVPGAMKN